MRSTRLVLVLALVVGSVTSARGATFSSTVLRGGSGTFKVCYVSNVGSKPVNVTVTLYDLAGNVIATGCDGAPLAPEGTCYTFVGSTQSFARCTVLSSSSQVRAVMALEDTSTFRTISAVPLTKK
jgi:hypothetical protein